MPVRTFTSTNDPSEMDQDINRWVGKRTIISISVASFREGGMRGYEDSNWVFVVVVAVA